MQGLFDVVVFNKNYSLGIKSEYLRSCEEFQAFNGQPLGNVMKAVKDSLSSHKRRKEGLLLLDLVISQCSAEDFVSNGLSFSQLLLSILHGSEGNSVKAMASRVLGELIVHLSTFPELSRQVAVSVIPTLVHHLVLRNENNKKLGANLECLHKCLLYFSGSCGGIKKTEIQKFLLLILDSCHDEALVKAAQCFALLPKCSGTGSQQGRGLQELWSNQMTLVLNTLHSTIDGFYQYLEMASSPDLEEPKELLFPPIVEEEPVPYLYRLSRRFITCSTCLQEMLNHEFPVSVQLPVEEVINISAKLCSISIPAILAQNPSMEVLAVLSHVPKLQCSAFKILNALIRSCKKLLIPYSLSVDEVILHVLNCSVSNQKKYGYSSHFGILRSHVYETAMIWMQALGISCGYELCSTLVDHLVTDIMPPHDQTLLRTSKVLHRNRKRKQGSLPQATSNEIQEKVNTSANQELCRAALITMSQLVKTFNCLLKDELYKKVYESITKVLSDIYCHCDVVPIPYSDSQCRILLYKILQDLVLNCPNASQACWNVTLSLFTKGSLDKDLNISSLCSSAIHCYMSVIRVRQALWQTTHREMTESQFLVPALEIQFNNHCQLSNPKPSDMEERELVALSKPNVFCTQVQAMNIIQTEACSSEKSLPMEQSDGNRFSVIATATNDGVSNKNGRAASDGDGHFSELGPAFQVVSESLEEQQEITTLQPVRQDDEMVIQENEEVMGEESKEKEDELSYEDLNDEEEEVTVLVQQNNVSSEHVNGNIALQVGLLEDKVDTVDRKNSKDIDTPVQEEHEKELVLSETETIPNGSQTNGKETAEDEEMLDDTESQVSGNVKQSPDAKIFNKVDICSKEPLEEPAKQYNDGKIKENTQAEDAAAIDALLADYKEIPVDKA